MDKYLKKVVKKSTRRKAARLALERAQKQLAHLVKPKKQRTSAETYIRAQLEGNDKGDRRITLSYRPALLGNPSVSPIRLDDVDLVGMTEDPQEFGEFVAALGITQLAVLTGVKLGPDTTMGEVLQGLVTFMGVDLEALKKAAEVDDATPPGEETVQASIATEPTAPERPIL